MAKPVYRIETQTRDLAGRIRRGANNLDLIMDRDLFDELLPNILETFRSYAPHRTGALREGLEWRASSPGYELVSTAENAGFNYTEVTRFGHRKRWIEPVEGDYMTFFKEGKFRRVKRFRGHQPKSDWALEAMRPTIREVDRVAGDLADRLAHEVVR